MNEGTVGVWHAEDGWGVIDSLDTPGGCWAHCSAVQASGYRALTPGETVIFEFEQADQDGYEFRAVGVWPCGAAPGTAPSESTDEDAAYSSTLTVSVDPTPDSAQT